MLTKRIIETPAKKIIELIPQAPVKEKKVIKLVPGAVVLNGLYWTRLPAEGKKLGGEGYHPVVVERVEDGVAYVWGCSTKAKPWLGDVQVMAEPAPEQHTYVRKIDGLRSVPIDELSRDRRLAIVKRFEPLVA